MIAIIGDILLDKYTYGTSTRLSAEVPVPIVLHNQSIVKPGGAANVYENIKSLTDDVVLSVKCDNPPIKERIMANGYQIARVDYEGDWHKWEILDDYKKADILVLSDYSKGCIKRMSDFTDGNAKIIVDPKKPLQEYSGAWCLKPNRVEFESYLGKWKTLEQLKGLMETAVSELNLSHLIVTLGEDGIAYYNHDTFYHEPTQAVEVKCVNGCGDTFLAVLAVYIDRGYTMIDAIKMANRAAGISVSHQGTYVIKPSDLT